MNTLLDPSFDSNLDLMFTRDVDLPPELIWQAWTDPKILPQWFCPKPWKVVACEIDLRAGGRFQSVMQSPEGQQFPNEGCYLEVVPNKKLVWTDAMRAGFRPVAAPASSAGFLFTGIILLEPIDQGTRYTAIVKHSNPADCQKHEQMGFSKGWGMALDQLIELMKAN
jgi:uncharacterized protein YndB with AHSA1/START domain